MGDLKENSDTFFEATHKNVSLFSGDCMCSLIYFIIYMRVNAYNGHYRQGTCFLGAVLGDVWAVFLWASEFLCALTYARDTWALDISQPNRYIMAMTDLVYRSETHSYGVKARTKM